MAQGVGYPHPARTGAGLGQVELKLSGVEQEVVFGKNANLWPTFQFMPTPKRGRICEVCGAEGAQNRYCKSCAVEVSRETMAQVALIGHATPKTARHKAQISKKISDHAVAITWWSPDSLPAWLNQEFLIKKILPRLRVVKIRLIAEALGVSAAYAAQIRTGRRRAHPRHWQELAKLAKVSGPFDDRV